MQEQAQGPHDQPRRLSHEALTGFTASTEPGEGHAQLYRRRIAGDGVGVLAGWLDQIGIGRVEPGGAPAGPFWASTVKSILDTGFGAGLLHWHGQYLPGAQPPVISAEEWAAYRAIRPRHRAEPIDRREQLWTDLVWCGCGAPMVPSSDSGHVYLCCTAHTGARASRRGSARLLERYLRHWLGHLVEDPATSAAATAAARDWAAGRAGQARGLAKSLSEPAPAADRDTRQRAYRAALAESHWHDPAGTAAVLLQDWDELGVPYRRALLRQIVARIILTTGHRDRTVDIVPVWSGRPFTPVDPVHLLVIAVGEEQLPRLRSHLYRRKAPTARPELPMFSLALPGDRLLRFQTADGTLHNDGPSELVWAETIEQDWLRRPALRSAPTRGRHDPPDPGHADAD